MRIGTMKIKELIKELQKGNPNNDVVISVPELEYTTDLFVSWDDLGVAVIDAEGGAKPY